MRGVNCVLHHVISLCVHDGLVSFVLMTWRQRNVFDTIRARADRCRYGKLCGLRGSCGGGGGKWERGGVGTPRDLNTEPS